MSLFLRYKLICGQSDHLQPCGFSSSSAGNILIKISNRQIRFKTFNNIILFTFVITSSPNSAFSLCITLFELNVVLQQLFKRPMVLHIDYIPRRRRTRVHSLILHQCNLLVIRLSIKFTINTLHKINEQMLCVCAKNAKRVMFTFAI